MVIQGFAEALNQDKWVMLEADAADQNTWLAGCIFKINKKQSIEDIQETT